MTEHAETFCPNAPEGEPTHALWERGLRRFSHDLESGEALGVPVRMLVAVEMEYYFRSGHPAHIPDAEETFGVSSEVLAKRREEAFRVIRPQIAAEIAGFRAKSAAEEALRDAWCTEAKHFDLHEIVSYLVYRELAVPTLSQSPVDIQKCLRQDQDIAKETLEFVCGTGLFQTGYYDNPDTMESRTQPAAPELALARYKRLLATLRAVADYYGMELVTFGAHINFSFHEAGNTQSEPMHTLRTEAGREYARLGTEGILASMADMAVLADRHSWDEKTWPREKTVELIASAARTEVRVLPGRFEYRLAATEDMAQQMLLLGAGFVRGVTRTHEYPVTAECRKRDWFMPGEGFNRIMHLPLLRLLQNSSFNSQGYLEANTDDISPYGVGEIPAALLGKFSLRQDNSLAESNAMFRDLKQLMATLRLDGDRLVCDSERFAAWLDRQRHESVWGLQAQAVDSCTAEAVTHLLERISYVVIDEIYSSDCRVTTSPRLWHKQVEGLSKSLQLILQTEDREQVIAELRSKMTHEDAILRYFSWSLHGCDEVKAVFGIDENDMLRLPESEVPARVESALERIVADIYQELTSRPVNAEAVLRNMSQDLSERRTNATALLTATDTLDRQIARRNLLLIDGLERAVQILEKAFSAPEI